MDSVEFSNQFDTYFNNITSNLAVGLNEYEKSVFLTKALNEIVKNFFTANSKGNNIQLGFDDSAKRLADFTCLMSTEEFNEVDEYDNRIDDRSFVYSFLDDVFIVINEVIKTTSGKTLQVMPLRFDEYTRLMSKPYKRPLKNQAWRLINHGSYNVDTSPKNVELIIGPDDEISKYIVRYIRKPKPIIIGDLDGLTIDGYKFEGLKEPAGIKKTSGCELDPMLHEEILQRAVELAKIAWTSTGNDNVLLMMTAGQRSE